MKDSKRATPINEAKYTPVDKEPKEEIQNESLFAKGLAFGKNVVNYVGQKVTDGVHWVAKNTDWLVPSILMGAPIVLGGLAAISGNNNPSTYDPETNEYLNLDHKLTNQELVQANKIMREEDVSKAEALNEMGVLKYEKKRK